MNGPFWVYLFIALCFSRFQTDWSGFDNMLVMIEDKILPQQFDPIQNYTTFVLFCVNCSPVCFFLLILAFDQ